MSKYAALIIDDEPDIRTLISMTLQSASESSCLFDQKHIRQ